MDKWFKDIFPDKNPYHNRERDQMRKKGVRNSSACEIIDSSHNSQNFNEKKRNESLKRLPLALYSEK